MGCDNYNRKIDTESDRDKSVRGDREERRDMYTRERRDEEYERGEREETDRGKTDRGYESQRRWRQLQALQTRELREISR